MIQNRKFSPFVQPVATAPWIMDRGPWTMDRGFAELKKNKWHTIDLIHIKHSKAIRWPITRTAGDIQQGNGECTYMYMPVACGELCTVIRDAMLDFVARFITYYIHYMQELLVS